jgi:hypothetical protein
MLIIVNKISVLYDILSGYENYYTARSDITNQDQEGPANRLCNGENLHLHTK